MIDDDKERSPFAADLKGWAAYLLILTFAGQYVLPYANPLIILTTVGGIAAAYQLLHRLPRGQFAAIASIVAGVLCAVLAFAMMTFTMLQARATMKEIAPACAVYYEKLRSGKPDQYAADAFTALKCPLGAEVSWSSLISL